MKKARKTVKRKYAVRSKVRLKAAPIVDWRADREFSQKQAAEFAGVSLTAWKNAEYGTHLQLVSAERISKAVGIPRQKLEEKRSA